MSDRILVNGDILDEIVSHDVAAFHFEAMGWHDWWGRIETPTGASLTFYMRDFQITDDEGWPVRPKDDGELLYPCKTRREDRRGILHQCEVERRHVRHRCECNATTRGSQ